MWPLGYVSVFEIAPYETAVALTVADRVQELMAKLGNVAALIEVIQSFIDAHNQKPKSFTWAAKVDTILAKARRARPVLDEMPSV